MCVCFNVQQKRAGAKGRVTRYADDYEEEEDQNDDDKEEEAEVEDDEDDDEEDEEDEERARTKVFYLIVSPMFVTDYCFRTRIRGSIKRFSTHRSCCAIIHV